MTTATELSGARERTSLDDIWALVQRMLDAGFRPIDIAIHPALISLSIRMQDNDRAAVDRAHDFFGFPPARLRTDYTWFPGEESEFKMYGDSLSRLTVKALPGVRIALYCQVRTQADASEHWSGPAPVGCSDHRCHCGQTFGERQKAEPAQGLFVTHPDCAQCGASTNRSKKCLEHRDILSHCPWIGGCETEMHDDDAIMCQFHQPLMAVAS